MKLYEYGYSYSYTGVRYSSIHSIIRLLLSKGNYTDSFYEFIHDVLVCVYNVVIESGTVKSIYPSPYYSCSENHLSRLVGRYLNLSLKELD